jgi:predicted LPLAT superfamily acyltransferase
MENKPKTYQRSINRAEDVIGVSGVVTLLAERARQRAEYCARVDPNGDNPRWNDAYIRLREFAVKIGALLEEN